MTFRIDEDKLRSVMPPPTSSWADDAKWSGAFLFVVVAIIAIPLALAWQVLRVLF